MGDAQGAERSNKIDGDEQKKVMQPLSNKSLNRSPP